jgi:type IV secretory pathway TrbD component
LTAYHIDWVGALAAGSAAAIVIFVIKTAFPRLAGVRLYLLAGLLIAAGALAVRELLRHLGI